MYGSVEDDEKPHGSAGGKLDGRNSAANGNNDLPLCRPLTPALASVTLVLRQS